MSQVHQGSQTTHQTCCAPFGHLRYIWKRPPTCVRQTTFLAVRRLQEGACTVRTESLSHWVENVDHWKSVFCVVFLSFCSIFVFSIHYLKLNLCVCLGLHYWAELPAEPIFCAVLTKYLSLEWVRIWRCVYDLICVGLLNQVYHILKQCDNIMQ